MADTHTVVKGDTLWGIAEKYLGSGTKYKQLATINNISNPNLIRIGQVIKLSGSGSSSTTKTTSSNAPTINNFGEQSDVENTLFATWTWSKSSTTDKYQLEWKYLTTDGVWFVGSDSTTTYMYSTYTIPENATKISFRVKPIAKNKTVKTSSGSTEQPQWDANWSKKSEHTKGLTPIPTPSTPSIEIKDLQLTTTVEGLTSKATHIEFKIVKNDTKVYRTGTASIEYAVEKADGRATYSCTVAAGDKYKVCCRAYRGDLYSDWTAYSGNVGTMPAAPEKIIECRASSETSVYLEWSASTTAETYDIEYATKKEYFDYTDQTTTVNGIEFTKRELIGLESGQEYFFRVRAVNKDGESAWTEIVSVIIGKKPVAPTTWSSTTTAITGEPLTLYWVHNAEDNSSQTFAELELVINGVTSTYEIENTRSEEEKDKTSEYSIDTSGYKEGTTIQWKVRTAGVTKEYGEWSVQRTVDVYAPPTLALAMLDKAGNELTSLEAFPFYISALAGPNTQLPTGYHLTVTSEEAYETTDSVGNVKMVNVGEELYSKYFDISDPLMVEMSASNIDLQDGIKYKITCTVAMNSGLTCESSVPFTVSWTEVGYTPNAEIGINEVDYTAYIRPYCEEYTPAYYKVTESSGVYTTTTETLEQMYGEEVEGATTTTGEQVYSGMTSDGTELYFCEVIESHMVDGVLLSVYRREFDGSFTELARNLVNSRNSYITDPHPSLDYARYRIVAVTETTGAVGYYDVPGHPVNGKCIVIQWDEEWSSFDLYGSEDEQEVYPWSGSILKLPYNVDISDNYGVDTSLVEYIGRKRPVSYYGTQLGETSSWNTEIPKDDKETLYALRRLAIWTGDVYVREPSGSGYWANISVSFSQTHCEVTIPVSLTITRVEGGI